MQFDRAKFHAEVKERFALASTPANNVEDHDHALAHALVHREKAIAAACAHAAAWRIGPQVQALWEPGMADNGDPGLQDELVGAATALIAAGDADSLADAAAVLSLASYLKIIKE